MPATAAKSTARYDIDAFLAAIGDVPVTTDLQRVRLRSRDYFWYSPVLNKQLHGKSADVVVTPRNEAEVIAVAGACAKLRIPLTPRGAATGNYGQAVPLDAPGQLLPQSPIRRDPGDLPALDDRVHVERGAADDDREIFALEDIVDGRIRHLLNLGDRDEVGRIEDIDQVMANAKDLVEVKYILKQFVNVKGD